jgi:hypothetical protein
VHPDARLLRSAELAAAAAASLGSSGALLLRGNGALTCAAAPGLAAARMWLLAAACRTWLDAAAAGVPRPLEAAVAESWRAVAGELLPRLWLHLSRVASGRLRHDDSETAAEPGLRLRPGRPDSPDREDARPDERDTW